MKVSRAALILLSASTISAFVPQTFTRRSGRRSHHYSELVKSSQEISTASTTTATDGGLDITPQEKKDDEKSLYYYEEAVNGSTPSQNEAADLATSAQEVQELATAYLQQYEGQSGASVLYSKFVEHGVKVVNGYSGGACLPILDQFHEDHPRHQAADAKPRIRWITNSNEQNAGHVTEGFAKACPMDGPHLPVGVCVATSGPGVTNLITPLQDAYCDGVPLVAVCGQAATVAPPDAFQSSPAVALTTPCTKWSYQIKSAAELPFVLDYAFYVARNGRPGPVFVDMPKDLQNQIIDDQLIQSMVSNRFTSIEADDEFARMTTRQRPDGRTFHAVHLGRSEKGLAFEIKQKSQDDNKMLKLEPVIASGTSDIFNADHNPQNMIHSSQTDESDGTVSWTQSPMEGAALDDMIDLIKMAKKPVIIAGQGCNNCPQDLKKLADTLQIPVTTTLHALGTFDERSNLALNMMGMHGHPTPNFMVQEADLIICVGSRFDDRITGRMSDFIPAAREAASEGRGGVIHVDIRLSEKSKQVTPNFFVHSTAKNFISSINAVLEKQDNLSTNTGDWLEKMKGLKAQYPIGIPKFPTQTVTVPGESTTVQKTPMSAQRVIERMNAQILKAGKMDDCIFTTGVGIHQMVAAQLITWTQPRQMLSSGSLGTMGVSLGYAIGAKLAQDGKCVISVDGDGSFNMTFTELKTLMEQKIPVKLLILDNEAQMMVEYWQRLFHGERYLAVRNKNPQYTKLAGAFGIKSLYCDCEEDLDEQMKKFLFEDPDKPVLFHVRIERTPCMPMVAPGQRLENMILEDEEFEVDAAAAPS